jgi:hypothetical protein
MEVKPTLPIRKHLSESFDATIAEENHMLYDHDDEESEPESAELSLDERRKRFVISQPVRNLHIAKKFQRAK